MIAIRNYAVNCKLRTAQLTAKERLSYSYTMQWSIIKPTATDVLSSQLQKKFLIWETLIKIIKMKQKQDKNCFPVECKCVNLQTFALFVYLRNGVNISHISQFQFTAKLLRNKQVKECLNSLRICATTKRPMWVQRLCTRECQLGASTVLHMGSQFAAIPHKTLLLQGKIEIRREQAAMPMLWTKWSSI